MERFDLRPDGSYRGFEDFCVLNGRRTDQKYSGSYETRVLRRFQQFANSPTVAEESLQLFRLIVFNCAIRNGDAHLKNFGVVYDDVKGAAHLASAYDLVTTTAYIPKDRMALTLNGSTEWPSGKDLIRFAESRSLASPRQLRAILEQTCDALSQIASGIETTMTTASRFRTVPTTVKPACSNDIANALPNPLLVPVTKMIFCISNSPTIPSVSLFYIRYLRYRERCNILIGVMPWQLERDGHEARLLTKQSLRRLLVW